MKLWRDAPLKSAGYNLFTSATEELTGRTSPRVLFSQDKQIPRIRFVRGGFLEGSGGGARAAIHHGDSRRDSKKSKTPGVFLLRSVQFIFCGPNERFISGRSRTALVDNNGMSYAHTFTPTQGMRGRSRDDLWALLRYEASIITWPFKSGPVDV